MKTLFGRPVMTHELGFFGFCEQQYFSIRLGSEDSPLHCRINPKAAAKTGGVRPTRQDLITVTGIRSIIDIQTRHPAETDDQVAFRYGKKLHHLASKISRPGVVCQAARVDNVDRETFRPLTLPMHGVDNDRMPARLADPGNSQEIPLQSAERKIIIQTKCQLHGQYRIPGFISSQQLFYCIHDAVDRYTPAAFAIQVTGFAQAR